MHLERAYCVWSILWLYSAAFVVWFIVQLYHIQKKEQQPIILYVGRVIGQKGSRPSSINIFEYIKCLN